MNKLPGEYETVCSIYGCGTIYFASSERSACPECGCSERDIYLVGSNERTAIYDAHSKNEIREDLYIYEEN